MADEISPHCSSPPAQRAHSHVFGIALLVALWLALAAWMTWDHRTEHKAMRNDVETLVRAVSEHTERVLWEADQLANSIALAVQRNGIDIPLANYFELGLAKFDVFLQLSITDGTGMLQSSTTQGFERVDLSDREHVRVHMDNKTDGLFIGKPVVGRTSGKVSVQLSRAVRDADGSLLGVIVISTDPTYFTDFYRELGIGSNTYIIVVGTHDHVIRARHTPTAKTYPLLLPLNSGLQHALAGPDHGTILLRDSVDNIERIVSFRKLEDYSVAVAVGLSRHEYLSPLRVRRNLLLLTGLLLTLFIIVIERRRTRLLDQLAATAERLDQTLVILAAKVARSEALLTAAPDAVAGFSSRGEIEDANPRLAELLDIPLDRAKQLNIAQFVSLMFTRDTSAERGAKQHALCTALVAALRSAPTTEQRIIVEIETDAAPAERRTYELRLTSLADPLSSLLIIIRDVTAQAQGHQASTHFIPAPTEAEEKGSGSN